MLHQINIYPNLRACAVLKDTRTTARARALSSVWLETMVYFYMD